MCWTFVHLTILVTVTCLSSAEDKIRASVSCPGYQTAFGGSCYEFVDLQHTFFSAQAWCEQHDGHLAFIPDKETQHFIQTLTDPKRDVWLGVAPSTSPNLQYSSTVEGALSWLDGSHLTYSNWVSSPQPGEECGHILRDSGFQWEATRDCNKKLHFICQFDSGKSIVCAGRNTTLQCGSGQVLMIDRSFYGRNNLHYCRSTFSPPTTTTEHKCGWVDVIETLTAHCSGRQICQIAPVVDSFVEPCPHLGSYLSVDYHCKDGLSLSVGTVAAVYDDVTINVKWLLHLQQGNLSCKMSTGDGHVIYLLSPHGLESSMVHRYTHPSTFVVVVECITRSVRITAQKIITIQEPIIEFGVIRCYAGKLSFHATDCKALWGEPFQIQIEVKAGTNVTYRVQSDDMLLSGLSVLRGNIPQNITVTPQMMTQRGPGCHQLTLYASNMVTFPEVSAQLQMCELEKVARLEATVLTEKDDCQDTPDITVGVSLEQGAPVLLLFSLSGDNSSYSETREMNTSKEIFQIGHPIQGSVQMKVRAWNVFSSLEVDVDMFAFCGKDSLSNGHDDHFLRPGKKPIRVVRSPMKAIATPSYSVPTKDITITLSISNAAKLNDPKKRYQWACWHPCRCQGNFEGLTYDITEHCLPDPLQYFKYHFNVINKNNNKVEKTESICITLNPQKSVPTWLSLTCSEGCNPIKKNKDAKIKMDCKGQQCPQIVWNTEDPRDDKNWPGDIEKDCYKMEKKRPLILKMHGGTEYTVSNWILEAAKSKGLDVTVVITSADVVPLYHKYIIKTSSSTEKEKDSKEKGSKEKGSKEKDSKEKDSKEKDSKEKGSKEKDSKEKDSKEKGSKEKDSKEKDSKEKGSKEKDSKEKGSKEKGSKEKGSKEKDSKEKDSKEKGSKEKGSKEKDSKEKGSKEKDSKEKDSNEKDSKEKDSKEKGSKEKDSKEKDSKEKDSKEKGSKEKDSKEKDSKEKGSKEKDSKEKDSKEKGSKEKDSKEKGSKEKGSKEKGSKEKDSKEKDSKEKGSKEKDSKEKGSKEKDSKEKDSKEKDSKEKGSKEKDSKEKDSKEKGSKEKDSKEKDSKEKGSKEKDSKEKGSKEKGSKEKGSKEKDSKEKDSKEKGSKEKGSKEKDSKEKGSKEKDSKEKDSNEKDSKEKDSKEKGSKEKDSKEKDSKEKDSKEKGSKEKDSKEKDSKEKGSKEKDSKEKDSKEKGSKEKDSKEKGSKEKGSKEKGSKEKDSKEKDSKEKGSKEKGSKEKDSKEKGSKEKDSKEKDSNEKDSKEKDSKEKGSKEKDSKEKGSKEKDSKEKDSKEKGSKEKDSKEKDSKEKGSKEKDSKEKGSKEKDSNEKDSKEEDGKEEDSPEETTAGPASTSPGTITDITATPTTTDTGDTSPPVTTNNFDSLKCSISPQRGTILDAFDITCNTEVPCSDCQYCFKTDEGKHLRCSNSNEVKAVFLPLGDSSSNYKLNIKATANNGSFVASTTVTAEVLDSTTVSSSSVDDLKASVENALVQLKEHDVLSGATVGQIFSSVANKLNAQSDESKQADRQKLREKMLDIMNNIVIGAPINTPDEVQATTRGLTAVVQKGTELSTSAQEEASLLFAALSSSLLHMNVTNSEENINEIHTAASTIVEGISNILHYSSNKNVSDALLLALSNTQSALLAFKDVHQRPTIIQQAHIGVFVHRVTPGSLHTESINIPNSSSPSFSLPKLPPDVLPSDEPVDIRMLSIDKNPFSWNERGNISGQIGALSLTTTDGSDIPVENLSEDVKILLPRPVGEQVNTLVLDLGNYSTTTIDIPVADNTLVLKMVPSNDPLPFKLLLGYMAYPTETSNVAMTEMPHQGATQEERYTWLLNPEDLKGNTGMHYLVVRPIVGPGIKSINASLTITSITTACKFWNESKLDWSSYGCRVGVETTHLVTVCLCNHLTLFGSSFFVTPNLVDPSRTAELFATFAENPVVVCFVGSLFVAYVLVVVWARRKDIRDTAKVKVTVLEDNSPMDEYCYLLSVSTGHRGGASTSSQVAITLLGAEGNSEPHHLTDPKKQVFERGAVDVFLLATPFSLGDLQGIRLWHDNSGSHPSWYVGNVMVQDLQTEQKWHFLCNSWLAIDLGDCSLDKVFPGSTEVDLKRFSNLFFMKTSKDFSDGHLWYSVISRPPSSTFTCVQRVSCCFSLLLCTMLTSIMFYGIPTDPSEQTMDLGHFEFSWQQFMIGVQSSLIMFPVNILIVSIFRNTRPRETSCCKRKTEKPDTMEQTSFSQANTNNMNVSVTLDSVIKDITRIAHSLSKTVKSNVPCTEFKFGPGQQVDINAVLSVVEDFIKQNNKTSDTTQPKTQSFCNPVQPQLPEASASMHPGSTVEGIQRKSNKTQYLYRQLCHIDKELSLLGPSSFPTQHSYNLALQQVQGMKGFLEDQLFTFSCANPDELTQSKLSPADSTNGDGCQKKRVCCHGGLPWWFIFVGWLLVIASSVVSGYFTMLYGLKFGKERSVSWLVSMIISFFQSILIIQPLKVLLLAVFFALVIKKVEEEDFENVEFDRNLGECKEQQMVRKNSNLYKPPPPADIEKMRRNKIMEQKAFALLKEILTYMGFMWMLLLVAYGQRDPSAFFLNQHIRNSFSRGISGSMSLGEVFTWANTSLLSNLFGVYPGFITDGNSKLVGNARLRQLRVQKDSCEIADSMLEFVPDCHAPYSWEAEDMGSYDPGWNHTVRDNISASTSSPWTYQTQAQLRAHPVWGKMVLYRGGGFVAELGPDSQNASSTLEYLFRNTWLDIYTRAIIVEFTVYNANVNLFCIVTLLLETTAVGAFQFYIELQSVRLYQSTGGLHIFVMAAEIIYLLFILYYMFLQGKLMKQQRWAYFKSKWNLLELTIILLSWSAVAVFIQRTLLGNRDMTYYQNHKDQFASFYETATADSVLQYLIAFLVLLATFKLWHLLRLNPKMNMITAALQRAWSDISGFLVIIVIMLVAYSVASNVIYGWRISTYRTFTDALLTIISLQVGIFNYDEVLDGTPVLGGLLFGSCVVFMTFVVLNLLLSVILVAFNQEQIYHKPSDEEEIVDLMLKKICSLFGIRYKDTNDNRGPDVNVADGLTLNNSKNILNNSSIDVNIYEKSDNSENL